MKLLFLLKSQQLKVKEGKKTKKKPECQEESLQDTINTITSSSPIELQCLQDFLYVPDLIVVVVNKNKWCIHLSLHNPVQHPRL